MTVLNILTRTVISFNIKTLRVRSMFEKRETPLIQVLVFCRWSPSMASRWLLAEPVLVRDSNMSEVVAVTPTGGPTRQESVTHIKRHKLASCNVPLVHGRPNPSISPRSRLTTHQRNHSLDFRYPFRSREYSARSFRDTHASYLRRVWRAPPTFPGTCWIKAIVNSPRIYDRCHDVHDIEVNDTSGSYVVYKLEEYKPRYLNWRRRRHQY